METGGGDAWRTPHVSQRLYSRQQRQQQQQQQALELSPLASSSSSSSSMLLGGEAGSSMMMMGEGNGVLHPSPPRPPVPSDSACAPSSRGTTITPTTVTPTGSSALRSCSGDRVPGHPYEETGGELLPTFSRSRSGSNGPNEIGRSPPQPPPSSSQPLAIRIPATSMDGILLPGTRGDAQQPLLPAPSPPSPFPTGGANSRSSSQHHLMTSPPASSSRGFPAPLAVGGDVAAAPVMRLRHRSGRTSPQRLLPPNSSGWADPTIPPPVVGPRAATFITTPLPFSTSLREAVPPPPPPSSQQQQQQHEIHWPPFSSSSTTTSGRSVVVQSSTSSSDVAVRGGEGEAGGDAGLSSSSSAAAGVSSNVKESWLCPICLQTYDEPCTISLCKSLPCRCQGKDVQTSDFSQRCLF